MAGYIASSQSVEWSTPQDLFDRLHARFRFTLDVAASAENAKCPRFFDRAQDGLMQPWRDADGSPSVAWCNPPYGRELALWTAKARREAEAGATVVLLVPARTDTRWFHDDVLALSLARVEFLRGRVRFGDAAAPAPFPSMLVIYEKAAKRDEARHSEQKAYRRGAEAMREAAALQVMFSNPRVPLAFVAIDIRALPIREDKP